MYVYHLFLLVLFVLEYIYDHTINAKVDFDIRYFKSIIHMCDLYFY